MKDRCWFWARGINNITGYGVIWDIGLQRNVSAHRAVYEALVGIIPKGLEIDHLCMVRRCINPKHLEAVTHKENKIRGVIAKRAELFN